MHRDEVPVFGAWTSDAGHVVELGMEVSLLASNAWSPVQSVAVERERGRFSAVQYHPEHDAHEASAPCRIRKPELIVQGSFANEAEAGAYVAKRPTPI